MARDFYHTGLGIGRSDAAKILDVTNGTAAASKSLITNSDNTIFGLAPPAVAITAVATTGATIADAGMFQFVTVTSANAANIVILPTPTPGTIVMLTVGDNGYELRSSAPATISINGGTGSGAESAIGANVTAIMYCTSATTWKGFQQDADGVLVLVEVAA